MEFATSPVEPSRTGLASPRCPRCDSGLALHQPDSGLPDRLLGACEGCKSWYVLDCEAGNMVPIPVLVPHEP